ncbi:LCP family protein [Paramicrobacterium humi]|uniref:LCP family protein n=1 Tax=Paramicrobacterium humi TaxID=640635 RepID=UPI001FE0E84E|nr:LCP family protein [Microbacterium humi]
MAVSAVGVGAWAVTDVMNDVQPGVALVGETPGQIIPDVNSIEGGINLLVIGSDSRAGQGDGYGDPKKETGVLNDVTMLLHVAEDHSNATIVSFPRDMRVPIPQCPRPEEDGGGFYSAMSSQPIHASLGYGGIACTAETVEQLTGLDIPFVGLVQFNGVVALSKALGGVDVCLAAPISDKHTDLDLPAGNVTLEGDLALQFLRTRYGVSDGSDLGRISNQQMFLSATVRELKEAGTLTDPVTLYSIAKVAAHNMDFSQNLRSLNTMVSIALTLKDIPNDKITFVQYPNHYGPDGEVYPTIQAAEVLMDAVKADKDLTITDGTGGSVPKDQKTIAPNTPETTNPSTASPGSSEAPDDSTVELPPGVYGQRADEVTCAAGNG